MTILTQILMGLLPVLSTILTWAIASAARAAKQRWGIEIEARHREALHSALMSGIRAALGRGLSDERAVNAAIAHAGRSVPDAMDALAPTAEVLTSLARSKLREVLGK